VAVAAEQGMQIVERDGVYHLAGVLNEFADLSPLQKAREPLRLNLAKVSRLNSIGIRNLLKFLGEWGPKRFVYESCPSEFVDQLNMIPALLGKQRQGTVQSLFVPYECTGCEREEEFLGPVSDYAAGAKGGQLPGRKCPKCGEMMKVLSDAFFTFLSR
jgi:hypothetical protein